MKNRMKSENNLSQYCLLFLSAVAATGALIYTRTVMIPFVFSIFFFALTSPTVKWLQNRTRLPRWLALTSVFLSVCLVSVGLILIITSSIGNFVSGAESYKIRLFELFATVLEKAGDYGFSSDKESIIAQLKDLPVFAFLRTLTAEITVLFSNFFLVLIFLIFLLAGESAERKPHPVLDEVLNKISRYLVLKSLLSLVTGVGVTLILIAFDVELAVLIGLLTFLLNFIPNVGFLLSTVLPLPLVFIEYGFGGRFLAVLILSLMVQLIMGNILEPRYLGESMDLHPVTILVFLIFWGLVWGVAGMFLAVPITAVMKIILNRFPTTKPVAELLAGRF